MFDPIAFGRPKCIRLAARCLLLGLSLFVTACSTTSQDVQVAADPTLNASTYKTYGWHQRGNRVVIVDTRRTAEVHQRVQAAINRELAAKGLRPSEGGTPDLLVAFDAGAIQQTEVTQWADTQYLGRPTNVPVETRDYRHGTMAVYLIDARSNALVWRGSADATFENPEQAARMIDSSVATMFRSFNKR